MTSTTPVKPLTRALVIGFWLAVWQAASLLVAQDLLLVSPVTVVQTLLTLVMTGGFWSSVWFSFARIVAGFILALAAGILLAAAAGASSAVRALLAPPFLVIRSVPVVSFIILVLLWADSGSLSVVISFLIVVPIIYTNVEEGIERADRKLFEMAGVFRVPFPRRLRAIDVPAVLPYLRAGCRIGLGLCWKSGIAAEVIGLPSGSIGERLYQAKIFLNSGDLFAWTIVIIVVSFAFEKLFLTGLRLFERSLSTGSAR